MAHCCSSRQVQQLAHCGCRYLMAVTGDRDMKLALESFQMSVGQALSHPHVPGLLRSLMVGRLMAAPGSPRMQVRRAAGEGGWQQSARRGALTCSGLGAQGVLIHAVL